MSCKNLTFKILAFCVVIFATFAQANRAFAYQFMADYIETDHGERVEGTLFKGEHATRFEVKSGKKKNTIQVTRYDKGLVWLIDLDKKTYHESYVPNLSNIYGEVREPIIVANGANFTREYIGEEKIDSYNMRKFVVKTTYKLKDIEVNDVCYEWYRTDFPLPVKTSNLDGTVTTEYKNITFRSLAPALFGTPKGFKKITD